MRNLLAAPSWLGLGVGLVTLLLLTIAPAPFRETLRERTFDMMLSAVAPMRTLPPATQPIVIVDIDPASLAEVGAWPWRREVLAELIKAVNAAKPSVIVLDILLDGPDLRSPAALARQLAVETKRDDLGVFADTLPDGDKSLIAVSAGAPLVFGWVLDPRGKSDMPATPILAREGARLGDLWRSTGASGPSEALASALSGAGIMSLPGDEDGVVRRVPLFAAIDGEARPGLGLEALRVSLGASGYLVSGKPTRLGVADHTRPLPAGALLRLATIGGPAPMTFAAGAVLGGRVDAKAFERAIVLIGGSAPELGALRPSVVDPLTPSSHFHAAAVRQFFAGVVPTRGRGAALWEMFGGIVSVFAAVLVVRRLRPLASVAVVVAGLGGVVLACLIAARFDALFDPVTPVAAGATAFLVASLGTFSEARAREARVRRRFEQHLAPAVVERIVADPSSVKLAGERREITALFTDIENFTDTTRAVGAEALLRVLDAYFEGVTGIIVAHGGMVDKFVGDAVHALFNAPFDLDDHPRKAIACAVAIRNWTERFRAGGLAGEIGLGRTRLGIETGPAIVGDVGLGAKVDYTAHGDAMNTAARLEALNKELGSSICVGPEAARRHGAFGLRSLGNVDIRGLGTLEIFTPI